MKKFAWTEMVAATGVITPAQMLAGLSQDPTLVEVSEEVETKTIQMIDEAK